MPALGDAAGAGDAARVGKLLTAGADVDEADERSWTALMDALALIKDNAPVARLLIEAGADLEKANKWGKTALVIACRARRYECIRLLLEAGAVPDNNVARR